MSDNEEGEPAQEKPFHVDRAKTGRSGCKKCKQKILQGELRFAKLGFNPFGDANVPMKNWHHISCIFDVFKRQRASTKKIESPDDIGGWFDLSDEDKQEIMKYFTPELKKVFETYSPQKKNSPVNDKKTQIDKNHKDNSFRAFRKLCVEVAEAASYLIKTSLIHDFLVKGSNGDGFKGDVELWCKLLLPGVIKRIYNLQSKQLVKIFSRILGTNHEEMLEDLEQGDVAETVSKFFEISKTHKPGGKAVLTLTEVDEFLEELSKLTKEDEQIHHFTSILKKCTSNDLKMIIRLIKHDLRINAGAKHVLEALHPDAYKAFQASRDLKTVVANALNAKVKGKNKQDENKEMIVQIKVMTPVLPMLAQACTSVEMAFKKCPNGFYSEIKYDGERVQLHKKGNNFSYFSRSLKPVLAHKVNHFKDYIPKAFPHGKDLILDSEILLVDTVTGKPLPFGSLGAHKKNEFKGASVCLFVFDCIYYNGESLVDKTMRERKEILEKNMVEIKNHIMYSEYEEIHKPEDLEAMMTKVFKLGLEGLVLKDVKSIYEPGKRHWLKVKKDYLLGGAMADSADLLVLGAWFGTGNKGGIMSSFLMGCYDTSIKKWVTVTKVHGGHDDETLDKLQTELDVIKISKDPNRVPDWLKCTKTMIPDFVAKDPKNMPVWEITGAEFTKNQVHTANGISIRFPRVTKIRDDKDWKHHTNLVELKALFEKSKDTSNFTFGSGSSKGSDSEQTDDSRSPVKTKERNKRKAEENNVTPVKKAKMTDNNDSDTETETEEEMDYESQGTNEKEVDLENPLPDIFKNCTISISKEYKDYDFLRRYIIAYGGVLHDASKNTAVENSKNKITHIVHLKNKVKSPKKDSSWSSNVRHVHITWIWDSIKLLERQSEKKYAVKISDKKK